jgi:hypothetical protein
MKIVFLWEGMIAKKGPDLLKSSDKKLGLVSRTTTLTDATKAHELGSRDCHPLARLQRYYHTLMRTWTQIGPDGPIRTNQTPRVDLERRRYGSAMQILATTHGAVDQGSSICGPERNRKELQKSRHDPQAQS